MALQDIKGNERVTERLRETVLRGTVSHAYLFEGEACGDKLLLAREFAKAILCQDKRQGDSCGGCVNCRKLDHGNYEDLIEISADGNSIKDEEILTLQGKLGKKPYGGDRHVVIISDADTMTLRAQNRLLKTLEEPSSGTVIMLLSENIQHLVATILSRCIIFRLQTESGEADEEAENLAKEFAELALAAAPFYKLSAALGEAALKKDTAYAFLDCLERRYRDIAVSLYDKENSLLYHAGEKKELKEQGRLLRLGELAAAISAIEMARQDLGRNINTAYALKSMILKL